MRDCWKGAERVTLGTASIKGAVRKTRAGEGRGMQDRLTEKVCHGGKDRCYWEFMGRFKEVPTIIPLSSGCLFLAAD